MNQFPLGKQNLLRVYHKNDWITSYPPDPFPFHHIGSEKEIVHFKKQVWEDAQKRLPVWSPYTPFHDIRAIRDQLQFDETDVDEVEQAAS